MKFLRMNEFEYFGVEIMSRGWFQTLFREKVKSKSIGNRTLNSEST